MSVFSGANQAASSSRFRGIFRYLVSRDGQSANKQELELMMSPAALLDNANKHDDRSMIRGNLREAVKMNFLTESEDKSEVELNQQLPADLRSVVKGEVLLPFTLSTLILTSSNDANLDFSKLVAWYLTQDILTCPGTFTEIEAQLIKDFDRDKLGMNDARYRNFEDWLCFLGFGWRLSHRDKSRTIADPCPYLRLALPRFFTGKKRISLREFFEVLSNKCPVFEFGSIRTLIEEKTSRRPSETHLSPVTSFALLRLHDEKFIQLTHRSDASHLFHLEDDRRQKPFSHVELV